MEESRPAEARAPKPLPIVRTGDRRLLDLVAVAEGTDEARARRHGYLSGYDVIYGYRRSDRPLTRMTLDEVDALQAGLGEHTPVGRYQLIRQTLRELRRSYGLAGELLFSPALQDQLGRVQMGKRRLDDPTASPADIQREFSKEWASIPDTTGYSHWTVKRPTPSGMVEVRQPTGVSSAAFQGALAAAQRLNGGAGQRRGGAGAKMTPSR